MKAAYLQGNKKILLKDIPEPPLQNGEVLVKIKSAAICGSDLKYFHADSPCERLQGHETSGVVLKSRSSKWKEGASVILYALSGCGVCKACKSGARMQCDHLDYVVGGFSEYMTVKENDCLPLPEWLDFDEGAIFGDCVGLAYHTLKRQNIRRGQTALIIGLGPVGLGIALMAKLMGAKLIAADFNRHRLKLADDIGVDHIIDLNSTDLDKALKKTSDIDIAIDCAGKEATQLACMKHCKKAGSVAFVAGNTKLTLDPNEYLLAKELCVTGNWYFNFKDFKKITEFIKDKLKPSQLITHSFPLDEAQEAFDLFASGNCGKVILHP